MAKIPAFACAVAFAAAVGPPDATGQAIYLGSRASGLYTSFGVSYGDGSDSPGATLGASYRGRFDVEATLAKGGVQRSARYANEPVFTMLPGSWARVTRSSSVAYPIETSIALDWVTAMSRVRWYVRRQAEDASPVSLAISAAYGHVWFYGPFAREARAYRYAGAWYAGGPVSMRGDEIVGGATLYRELPLRHDQCVVLECGVVGSVARSVHSAALIGSIVDLSGPEPVFATYPTQAIYTYTRFAIMPTLGVHAKTRLGNRDAVHVDFVVGVMNRQPQIRLRIGYTHGA